MHAAGRNVRRHGRQPPSQSRIAPGPSRPRASPATMPRMSEMLAILGVACAAFAVWLTVRIVNRRERWAKWTAATVVGLPLLYVLSFGPACWWLSKPVKLTFVSLKARQAPALYSPFGWVARRAPSSFSTAINWYATVGVAGNEAIACGILQTGDAGIVFLAR